MEFQVYYILYLVPYGCYIKHLKNGSYPLQKKIVEQC